MLENNTDNKSQFLGMGLLAAMLFGYMYFSQQNQPKSDVKPVTATEKPATKTVLPVVNAISADSTKNVVSKEIIVENQDIKVTFTSKGGAIKEVLLKKYQTYDKKPLILFDAQSSSMALELPTNQGKVNLNQLNFETANTSSIVKTGDSTQVVFVANVATGQQITQTYSIKDKGYEVGYDLKTAGMESSLKNEPLRLTWTDELKQLENDIVENRKTAKINYWLTNDEELDDLGLSQTSGTDSRELAEPISWVSFKQLYFNAAFIAKNTPIEAAKITSTTNEDDKNVVKVLQAELNLPIADLKTGKANYNFFFGPNEYYTVKPVTNGFHRNVFLGYDFVKPINRYVFVPLFYWFEKFISNYGLLIIIVVLVIKAVLTPLVYTSYINMAKMRLLAPELNAIKEKVGDDMGKQQQEQMKLYQQVGVSPLSGCIPVFLQMPILMSVFFLFPNMIMFRQKEFLWAKDLSTYDAPIQWATNLPIIGNHISLFVVLMTISSLAFTYYNNQNTPDQNNPNMPIDMKKMGYIFPLVFFFVLNSFPAALSFYYLVSNVVTICQQLIIRKFVDEDKIRAVLDENRKKFIANPTAAKKSKFQSFLEQSMKAAEENKKQQEAQKKGKKK